MGLQRLLARASLRAGWGGAIALFVVVALGFGAALTSIEAADRTVSAYPDYLRQGRVADVVINPVLANERTEEIIRGLPGVRTVVSDSLLTAYPMNADLPVDSVQSLFVQTRTSNDGRYSEQDLPIVSEGRMIRAGAVEAFIDEPAAERLGFEVGDVMDVSFRGINVEDPTSVDPGPEVRRTDVPVVGIGTFADSVLPDEAYLDMRILLTEEAAGSADCLQRTFEADDPRSELELLVASVPSDCAMTYRNYSLDLEGGRGAAAEVVDELGRQFEAENENLPAALREADIGYGIIPSFTEDDERSVRQSLAPAVLGARGFGIGALVATLVTVALLVVRHLRRRSTDLAAWRTLGMATPSRAAAASAVPLLAAVLGVVVSVVVAWIASPVGPMASARDLRPHSDRSLGSITLLTAVVALVVLVAILAIAAFLAARRAGATEEVRDRTRRQPAVFGSLAGLGLRAALRGRDAVPALLGSIAAVVAISSSLIFAVGLNRQLDTPERYGWTFDVALLANFGYGPVDLETAAEDLDRPEVERWGAATLTGFLSLDGESTPAIASREGFDELVADTSVVDGRLPSGPDEIALGALTAEDLDREVGDQVVVSSFFGEHEATVSGLVVLPAIGPFQSDGTSIGTGALVPGPLLEAASAGSEEATGMTPADLADSQAALIAVDLADGVDEDAVVGELEEQLAVWDPTGFGLTYADPIRPATVIDLDAIRGLPGLTPFFFGAAMLVAVVAGLASGTKARREELAVLRALGASPRQRRTSIRVHALVTAVVGLVVGLPIGLVAARFTFRRFAEDLGAAADLPNPLPVFAAVTVGAVLLALVTAEVLARRAVVNRALVADPA